MSKHTPGPWGFHTYHNGEVVVETAPNDESRETLAFLCRSETIPFDTAIANARLMAASPLFWEACTPAAPGEPEPLEALENAIARLSAVPWKREDVEACRALLAGLRAAVRQARGETE